MSFQICMTLFILQYNVKWTDFRSHADLLNVTKVRLMIKFITTPSKILLKKGKKSETFSFRFRQIKPILKSNSTELLVRGVMTPQKKR